MKYQVILISLVFIQNLCHSQGKFDFNRIEDNSFLIEEAYNQEPGIIQHISAFEWLQDKTWIYTYTEEWPLRGQKHQLSFTIPYLNPGYRGVGDIALNYRYQVVLGRQLAFSPRFTLLLPTGDASKGIGNGMPGYQFNLPVSFLISRKFVTHYNLGATFVFSAKDTYDNRSNITNVNYGFSIIYLLMENFNLMLEMAGNTIRTKPENQRVLSESLLYINPGCRAAFNFKSGLQIVPGVAFPIAAGSAKGNNGVFLYLSFEHPVHK